MSVLAVVALVVAGGDPVEDVEHHEYLMVLVEMEGQEVAIGWVVEEVVVIREEQ